MSKFGEAPAKEFSDDAEMFIAEVVASRSDVVRFSSSKLKEMSILESRATADDIAQETIIKALKFIEGDRGSKPHNIKSWLFSIAQNIIIDHQRAQSHWNMVSISGGEDLDDPTSRKTIDLPDKSSFEQKVFAQILVDEMVPGLNDEERELLLARHQDAEHILKAKGAVEKVMPMLDDSERELIRLRYLEGLDIEDLAERLQIKRNTLRPNLSRAVHKMLRLIAQDKLTEEENELARLHYEGGQSVEHIAKNRGIDSETLEVRMNDIHKKMLHSL